ncbi:MAG TPA: GTP cyclohydrolase II [Microlunatus sp.]|nr:GTP cyclohydrolase II [Microlunatus sp.]
MPLSDVYADVSVRQIRSRRAACVVETSLATAHGRFRMLGFAGPDGTEHVALVLGDVSTDRGDPPLVRVHSECLTGDALGSRRCDCGEQLAAAFAEIGRAGRGMILYLRGHEGRGIGLLAKLQAYALQDGGADTVDANLALGYPADARTYEVAADILTSLGVDRIRLLSSNPAKVTALTALGVEVVARQPLPVADRPENAFYLSTKRSRMGHDNAGRRLDPWAELLAGRVPPDAADAAGRELAERYGPLVAAGSDLVIAQLAQSADGFIATRTGDADHVSGAADREHLHRLRALVDAVVVGANTVVADDPQLTVRAVTGRSPVRVLLDPRARITQRSRVLRDELVPTLWMVGRDAPVLSVMSHVEVVRLPRSGAGFAPDDVLAALRGRGLGRVLVEGGGRLVSAFLGAGLLDRLWLTTAPVFIGDGVPGIRFDGPSRLADALRAPARRYVLGDDLVCEFDLSATRAPALR